MPQTFLWQLSQVRYLAGLFQLSASFPGFRENGAHHALGADVSCWLRVRYSTIRLIRVI